MMMMNGQRGDQYNESHNHPNSQPAMSSNNHSLEYNNHRPVLSDNPHHQQHFNRPTFNHHHHHHPNFNHRDCGDAANHAKLYVVPVPRTTTEEDIRSLFGEHGNIVEVVHLKDKRTGLKQECCFVKYAKREEADRAIGALSNQYIFPGATIPIRVRYADSERDRIGAFMNQEFKLFVGCLNKQASRREVEEIFSAYGIVESVFFVRDEMQQNRGFGFIQFSQRDMALAAISALNGIYIMRGCDQPLIVRFASPKRPRIGDSRFSSRFQPPGVGPHFREPCARPAPQQGDSAGVITGPASASFRGNGLPFSAQQSPESGSKPITVSGASIDSNLPVPSTISSAPAVSTSTEMGDPLDCDWSEHTCPDGYKYYYNCITCESRWEKPEEYTNCEQRLQKHQEQQTPSQQQLHSPSNPQVLSTGQVSHVQQVELQTQLSNQKLEQPSLSAMEIDNVQVPASPVIAPACVLSGNQV